jgi:hypothetical protein
MSETWENDGNRTVRRRQLKHSTPHCTACMFTSLSRRTVENNWYFSNQLLLLQFQTQICNLEKNMFTLSIKNWVFPVQCKKFWSIKTEITFRAKTIPFKNWSDGKHTNKKVKSLFFHYFSSNCGFPKNVSDFFFD